MNESSDTVARQTFANRKVWLVIFGLFTALGGCLCALLIPLMLAGVAAQAKAGTSAGMDSQGAFLVCAIYGFMAVGLVWLGVGSTLARRWARALLLIGSWMWLIFGVFSMIMAAFTIPPLLRSLPRQQSLPGGAEVAIMVTAGGFVLFGFVILPAVWVFFYSRKSVKATCEARNPLPSWTDACPLPVLAVSLLLACCVPAMAVGPFVYHGVIPFFGLFVTGFAGTAIYLLLMVLWGYCAWKIYQLNRRAWGIVLVSMILLTISNVVTYAIHDVAELYRLVGYSTAEIERIQQFSVFKGRQMAWMTLLSSLPMLAYLGWVGRYFPKRGPGASLG